VLVCTAVYAITLQITKAVVDGACVLIRDGPTPPLEPCYGRALISGAVAGFASMIIADNRKLHPNFYPPKDYMVSTHTLISVIGGSLAGVMYENERLHNAQQASL
jgi:hypothetical protein